LAGKTEVLGENLPRHHFVQHKSHLPDPGANPGRRGGKPATNRFICGAAQSHGVIFRKRIYMYLINIFILKYTFLFEMQ
jgi:hypothetical protein